MPITYSYDLNGRLLKTGVEAAATSEISGSGTVAGTKEFGAGPEETGSSDAAEPGIAADRFDFKPALSEGGSPAPSNGFPNGRRAGDDVLDIVLTAAVAETSTQSLAGSLPGLSASVTGGPADSGSDWAQSDASEWPAEQPSQTSAAYTDIFDAF